MKLLAGLGFPVWVCAAVMLSVLVNKSDGVQWIKHGRGCPPHAQRMNHFPKRVAQTKAEGGHTACQAAWRDQLMHCCRAGGTVLG